MDMPVTPPEPNDPYLWLEDVLGEQALDWVRARNAASREVLTAPASFATTRDRIRAVLDSKAQIPGVGRRGEHLTAGRITSAHPVERLLAEYVLEPKVRVVRFRRGHGHVHRLFVLKLRARRGPR